MAEGYVYILTNVSMPGYVKIGRTEQANVADRVRQLDNTSTPLPFEIFYAAKVPDCQTLEQTLHKVFDEKRVRKNREFFATKPDLAKLIIKLVAIEEEAFTDAQQDITPDQRAAIEAAKSARTARLTLERIGLKPGAILSFSKDPKITCEVVGPRSVLFRGEVQSLSQAALTVIRELGYNWAAISGFEYWMHDGVRLSAIEPVGRVGDEVGATD